MTIKKFIARLNWRLAAVHYVAAWFFMYSFQTLSALHNTALLNIITKQGSHDIEPILSRHGIAAAELTDFVLWTSLANTAGLLVAFCISLVISTRRKWFWFNSLLVLVLAIILARLDQLAWQYLKRILLMPGKICSSAAMEFLVNGLIMLALGLLIFFWPKANRFIEKGSNKNTASESGHEMNSCTSKISQ